MFHSSFGLIIV